jgi:hypothetical protein
MEVFITRSNAERIITKVDLSDIDIACYARELKFKWFNKRELKKLKALEELYSNPILFLHTYVKLQPRKDGHSYVFSSSVAFHTNEHCDKMLSDFENIKIPSHIMKSGRKQDFIDFCTNNQALRMKYPDQFQNRLRWEFGVREQVMVRYENSGADRIENMSLEEVSAAINRLLEETNAWIAASSLVRNVIEVFGKQSFNYNKVDELPLDWLSVNASKEKVGEILKRFEINVKQHLITLFKHYFRMKNNKSLRFDHQLLTQLGFKQCSTCQLKEAFQPLRSA